MKDINKMMMARSIFLYNIGLIYANDERLYLLLEVFIDDYIDSYFETFNMLYYFECDKEYNLYIKEEEEWQVMLSKYLEYFANKDYKNISKMYDIIGFENIEKIIELVNMFYAYVMALNDINNTRIRS